MKDINATIGSQLLTLRVCGCMGAYVCVGMHVHSRVHGHMRMGVRLRVEARF